MSVERPTPPDDTEGLREQLREMFPCKRTRRASGPLVDEWSRPYYDPAACWGCGLYTEETEAQREALFRHPLFGPGRLILCSYCKELEEVQRERA